MSIKAQIKSIDPLFVQASNKTVHDVTISFVDGKKVVGSKKVQFDKDTTETVIRKEVAGYAHEFEKETLARIEAEKDAKEKANETRQTASLRNNLIDKDIEPKANVVKS